MTSPEEKQARDKATKEFVEKHMVPHIKDLVEGSVSLYTEFSKWLTDKVRIREEEIRADERTKLNDKSLII